jgi:hypothetical protein
VTFVSPAVLAAAGSHLAGAANGGGDSLVLWDTLQPPGCPPAAAVAAHEGGATAMALLPGGAAGAWGGSGCGAAPWPLIATAGRNGDIAAHDLRMLGGGGKDGTVIWRSKVRNGGVGHTAAVTSLAVIAPPAARRRRFGYGSGAGSLLISGCKDGDIRVWGASTGVHLQQHPTAHERHTFLAPRGGGANVLYMGVAKILALDGGALSCGGDGTVKLFRLTPVAFDLAGAAGAAPGMGPTEAASSSSASMLF